MATQTATIYPEAEIHLDKTDNESWLVHGSVYYNGYVYGIPRTYSYSLPHHNALCKVKADDYSDYIAVCMKDEYGVDLSYGEAIVECGGYLYGALYSANLHGIIRIDPVTLAHSLIYPYGADGLGTDGTYLYFMSGGALAKFNPVTLEATWLTIPSNSMSDVPNSMYGQPAHSVLCDETHIWLNCVLSGGLYYKSRIHKVLRSNMSYVGYAEVAQTTDDMGQNDDYIFCGFEPGNSGSFGYTWGAAAVRKSDLAVFCLPKLAASDSLGTLSYSSLRFGNYLIDCKVNNHLYVIDITDPSQWLITSNPNDFVLYDYNIIGSSGYPHNEIVMDNDGKFHEFVWAANTAAYLMRIVLPLNFTTAPELLTVPASGITSTFATLNGYITASGGRAILDCGFLIGTQSGVYGSPVSALTVPVGSFSFLMEGLTPGQTYYYKSYASNSIGTTYSDESSFTLNATATVPAIMGTITKDSVILPGATVVLVNTGSGQFVAKKLTNVNGRYAFSGLLMTSKYHVAAEYENNGAYYQGKSYPFKTPNLK